MRTIAAFLAGVSDQRAKDRGQRPHQRAEFDAEMSRCPDAQIPTWSDAHSALLLCDGNIIDRHAPPHHLCHLATSALGRNLPHHPTTSLLSASTLARSVLATSALDTSFPYAPFESSCCHLRHCGTPPPPHHLCHLVTSALGRNLPHHTTTTVLSASALAYSPPVCLMCHLSHACTMLCGCGLCSCHVACTRYDACEGWGGCIPRKQNALFCVFESAFCGNIRCSIILFFTTRPRCFVLTVRVGVLYGVPYHVR